MSQTKLQVIASTMPIPENAGKVKGALERHVNDMNKIEQCAEEIGDGFTEYVRHDKDFTNGDIAKILTKHFHPVESFTLATILQQGHSQLSEWAGPLNVKQECACNNSDVAPNTTGLVSQPPTSTPSLDEVVEKCYQNLGDHWPTCEAAIRQAVLEYNTKLSDMLKQSEDMRERDSYQLDDLESKNASLLAEVEKLKACVIHGCIGGAILLERNEALSKLSEVNNLIESHKLDLEAQKNAYERKLAGAVKELKRAQSIIAEDSPEIAKTFDASIYAMKGNQ